MLGFGGFPLMGSLAKSSEMLDFGGFPLMGSLENPPEGGVWVGFR
jgi:hypothetical protein